MGKADSERECDIAGEQESREVVSEENVPEKGRHTGGGRRKALRACMSLHLP